MVLSTSFYIGDNDLLSEWKGYAVVSGCFKRKISQRCDCKTLMGWDLFANFRGIYRDEAAVWAVCWVIPLWAMGCRRLKSLARSGV